MGETRIEGLNQHRYDSHQEAIQALLIALTDGDEQINSQRRVDGDLNEGLRGKNVMALQKRSVVKALQTGLQPTRLDRMGPATTDSNQPSTKLSLIVVEPTSQESIEQWRDGLENTFGEEVKLLRVNVVMHEGQVCYQMTSKHKEIHLPVFQTQGKTIQELAYNLPNTQRFAQEFANDDYVHVVLAGTTGMKQERFASELSINTAPMIRIGFDPMNMRFFQFQQEANNTVGGR